MTANFVEWDPHFFVDPDERPDDNGHVAMYDAEGNTLLRVDPRLASVVAAALEYAHADAAAIYGDGWMHLSNENVARLLRQHTS